jgi:hypothetical protein
MGTAGVESLVVPGLVLAVVFRPDLERSIGTINGPPNVDDKGLALQILQGALDEVMAH